MEKFFSIIEDFDEISILEFLHRRYHDTEAIMKLPIDDFLRFMDIAKKKEQEEMIRAQWISLLPGMSRKEFKYMNFEEYKNKCTGANIDRRPKEEIIKELEMIHGCKIL